MAMRDLVSFGVGAFCLFASVALGEEVKCEVKGGELAGTVEVPEAKGKVDIVVMISGSGPTDRDGNNPLVGKGNSLKMVAEGLKAAGIATVRYDKRGLGGSARLVLKEDDLRFEDYAQDAGAWIRWAKKDGRFGKVFVLGHSEGALLGTLAALKEGVDGVVLVSGPGRPAGVVVKEQLEKSLPESFRKEAYEITDAMTEGKRVEKVPRHLLALYRPSVQGYVMSWYKYDPAAEVAKLKVPVLVVQGTTDVQVSVEDAKLLAKAAGERGRLVVLDGMNHVLKKAKGSWAGQKGVYADGTLPLAEGLLEGLVGFLKGGGEKGGK